MADKKKVAAGVTAASAPVLYGSSKVLHPMVDSWLSARAAAPMGINTAGMFGTSGVAAAPAQYAQGSLFNQVAPGSFTTVPTVAPEAASIGSKLFPAFGSGGTQATAKAAAKAAGTKPGLLAPGGRLAAGTVGHASIYGTAGLVGSEIVNNLNLGGSNSNVDRGSTGALAGAGIGAGVGSLILPGPGTVIGAGVGAVGGGALNIFRPRSTPAKRAASVDKDFATHYNALLSALPNDLDFATQSSISSALTDHAQMLKALGLGSKGGKLADGTEVAGIKDTANSLIAQIPAFAQQRRDQAEAFKAEAAKELAFQQYVNETMKPYLDSFTQNAEKSAAKYTELGRLDLAADARTSASRLAAAYATQANGLQASINLQQKLSYASQVANILQQKQIAQLTGSSSTGQQSLSDMAAK